VAVILALIIGAIVYTVKKKSEKSEGPAPIPGPPGATDKKYADALKIATQFFDIQKCKFSRRTPPPPIFFFYFSQYSIKVIFFLNTSSILIL